MVVETTANCPACDESGLTLEVGEAAHDASLLDIVATCPACGWKGNSFIYVSEMDMLEAGNREPV